MNTRPLLKIRIESFLEVILKNRSLPWSAYGTYQRAIQKFSSSFVRSFCVFCDQSILDVRSHRFLVAQYLKLRPIHRHVHSISIRPPFQVLFMVSIVNRMVKFLINLRQPEIKKSLRQKCHILFYLFGCNMTIFINDRLT